MSKDSLQSAATTTPPPVQPTKPVKLGRFRVIAEGPASLGPEMQRFFSGTSGANLQGKTVIVVGPVTGSPRLPTIAFNSTEQIRLAK